MARREKDCFNADRLRVGSFEEEIYGTEEPIPTTIYKKKCLNHDCDAIVISKSRFKFLCERCKMMDKYRFADTLNGKIT